MKLAQPRRFTAAAPSLTSRSSRLRARELDKDNEIARHLFLQQFMARFRAR